MAGNLFREEWPQARGNYLPTVAVRRAALYFSSIRNALHERSRTASECKRPGNANRRKRRRGRARRFQSSSSTGTARITCAIWTRRATCSPMSVWWRPQGDIERPGRWKSLRVESDHPDPTPRNGDAFEQRARTRQRPMHCRGDERARDEEQVDLTHEAGRAGSVGHQGRILMSVTVRPIIPAAIIP